MRRAIQKSLDVAHKTNKTTNAFISIFDDQALARVESLVDAAPESRGKLHGVPMGIKDAFCVTDTEVTAASEVLRGFVSPYTATVVQRMVDAGGIIIGKTNMDEFSMGSSTTHSCYGPAKNPRDVSKSPGGSSGGSAAAVASGAVRIALGSDTGGSVRQPASFCEVVGFKPSYGRVSRYGLIAFSSTLDCPSIVSTNVEDAHTWLSVVEGDDEKDASMSPPDPRDDASPPELPLRIGVPEEYICELNDTVRASWEHACNVLEESGVAKIELISLPSTRYSLPTYYVLSSAEASSNLARYDGIRYGNPEGRKVFGDEVRRRILVGTFVLSNAAVDKYFVKAQAMRRKISEEYRRVFESGVDLLLTPTTPTPAFDSMQGMEAQDEWVSDIFTVPASLAGLPAISLPFRDGIGIQLIGQRQQDRRLLAAALPIEEQLNNKR